MPSFDDTSSYSDNTLDFRPQMNANWIHFASELQNEMKTVDFEMTTLEDYVLVAWLLPLIIELDYQRRN